MMHQLFQCRIKGSRVQLGRGQPPTPTDSLRLSVTGTPTASRPSGRSRRRSRRFSRASSSRLVARAAPNVDVFCRLRLWWQVLRPLWRRSLLLIHWVGFFAQATKQLSPTTALPYVMRPVTVSPRAIRVQWYRSPESQPAPRLVSINTPSLDISSPPLEPTSLHPCSAENKYEDTKTQKTLRDTNPMTDNLIEIADKAETKQNLPSDLSTPEKKSTREEILAWIKTLPPAAQRSKEIEAEEEAEAKRKALLREDPTWRRVGSRSLLRPRSGRKRREDG
jgi:hypothetical protein